MTRVLSAFALTILLFCVPLTAQQDTVVIQLGMGYFSSDFDETLLDNFEAEFGVEVQLAEIPRENYFARPSDGADVHLDAVRALATSADVILLTETMISTEASRSGYLLDIEPLVETDTALRVDDYYPAMWDSFAWVGSRWAFPYNGAPITWIYDPSAFDEAGLAYPNDNWTIDDAINAVNMLETVVNADDLEQVFSPTLEDDLVRSVLGSDVGNLTDPNSVAFAEQWLSIRETGVITRLTGDFPLQVASVFELSQNPGDDGGLRGALLPGGTAGLNVQGLVISAGTAYPELSYELVKYLSSDNRVHSDDILAGIPANRTVQDLNTPSFNAENVEFVERALANAIPHAQTRFIPTLTRAIQRADENNLPLETALADAQLALDERLAAADARQSDEIVVDLPDRTPQIGPDEIVLRVGYDTGALLNLPNENRWSDFVETFPANDPEVGFVEFSSDLSFNLGNWLTDYDCIYTPQPLVTIVPDALVPVDPLLDSDPSFDRDDVLLGVSDQLATDGIVYGFPLDLTLEVLAYRTDDLPFTLEPGTWTLNELISTLSALSDTATSAPLAVGTNIDLLIAAAGGLPIDYSTQPPTLNLDDPNTQTAIQQILDLARDGLLAYAPLARFTPSVEQAVISSTSLDAFLFARSGSNTALKPFPSGQRNAARYTVNAGYISIEAPAPEACYRFFSAAANQPDLFTGLPARGSLINQRIDSGTLSDDTAALYATYQDLLVDPQTIILPQHQDGTLGIGDALFLNYWLFRAYDRYVLENADLTLELADAQVIMETYLTCSSDPGVNSVECARTADPEFDLLD